MGQQRHLQCWYTQTKSHGVSPQKAKAFVDITMHRARLNALQTACVVRWAKFVGKF
jgi:hypothetical protein